MCVTVLTDFEYKSKTFGVAVVVFSSHLTMAASSLDWCFRQSKTGDSTWEERDFKSHQEQTQMVSKTSVKKPFQWIWIFHGKFIQLTVIFLVILFQRNTKYKNSTFIQKYWNWPIKHPYMYKCHTQINSFKGTQTIMYYYSVVWKTEYWTNVNVVHAACSSF